jgi:Fe-S-cluster containining protein
MAERVDKHMSWPTAGEEPQTRKLANRPIAEEELNAVWTDLDPDLITGDICMQCGMCCKTTWTQERFPSSGVDRAPYLKAMFDDRDKSEVVTRKRNGKEVVSVVNWCSHLKEKPENIHHVMCDIYENRPQMCSDYNCFRAANGVKRLPEYYDLISKLIVDRKTKLSDGKAIEEEVS